jgi:dCTP deaminase
MSTRSPDFGGVLSGLEIRRRVEAGSITISPFDTDRLGVNSYDVALGSTLAVYDRAPYAELSTRVPLNLRYFDIPAEGFQLQPGKLYLGETVEYTETEGLVPSIDGRSSMGRLGAFIHITAGRGDIGFKGKWTLEIVVVEPLRIFAGDVIAQLSYSTVIGLYDNYNGKYQGDQGLNPSKGLGLRR